MKLSAFPLKNLLKIQDTAHVGLKADSENKNNHDKTHTCNSSFSPDGVLTDTGYKRDSPVQPK